jgi:5-deoxy-glucuronate isomerase
VRNVRRHFRPGPPAEGYQRIVGPGDGGLKYIEMGMLRLGQAGSVYRGATGEREVGLNLLAGVIRLKVRTAGGELRFDQVGRRAHPFAGPPAMVYLPAGAEYTIEVLRGPLQAAVYSSPASHGYPPRAVPPEEVVTVRTGELNWTRLVRQGIAANVQAHRLIMGETLTPSGNWASYPPHKHDVHAPPSEQPSEEVYSFHFDRPGGYGFIRLYTPADVPDPFDETYTVCDGEVIVIERGYHPIAVAPGYRCCYLFCLAGEERNYGAWSDDPAHAWIRGAEVIVRGNELA